MRGYAGVDKYLYNGKELQEDLGLQWYDYGFRFYDAAIGRFFSIDPLSESNIIQSPFVYAANNPVNLIDFLGLDDVDPDEEDDDEPPRGDSMYALWLEENGLEDTDANFNVFLGYLMSLNSSDRQGEKEDGGKVDNNDNEGCCHPDKAWEAFVQAFIPFGSEIYPLDDDDPRLNVIYAPMPDLPIGPGGGKLTLKTIKYLLVKDKGVWKWAINGRAASQETLKRLGLNKPTINTVRGKKIITKEFEQTVSGVPNSTGPKSFWGKVKESIAIFGQLFQ